MTEDGVGAEQATEMRAVATADDHECAVAPGGWRARLHEAVLDEADFIGLTISYGKQADPAAWRRLVVRPVALKGGRLIGHGPPAEFMTSDRLEQIYDVAMGVFPHPVTGNAVAYVHDRRLLSSTWEGTKGT